MNPENNEIINTKLPSVDASEAVEVIETVEVAPAPAGTTSTYTPRNSRPAGGMQRRGGGFGGGRGGFRKGRKKVCRFCIDRTKFIDYKDAAKLRGLITERSKILPRRATGTCAFHQRELAIAIKRSRQIALISYV